MADSPDLFQLSIDFLMEQQQDNGAWYASPMFETYHYCWFRDSSFIAYAMDRGGQLNRAEAFHGWVLKLLSSKVETMRRVVEIVEQEQRVPEELVIHTRYRADGSVGDTWWENHQLDGLGAWLWAYADHRRRSGAVALGVSSDAEVVNVLSDYLSALWRYPCYDLWEEFGDRVHLYTLAAVRAGLIAAEELTGTSRAEEVRRISEYVGDNLVQDGVLMKSVGDPRVDASLLAAIVPFQIVAPGSAIAEATVAAIRRDLVVDAGVHRYVDDSYYGGGVWLLLSAWLGWYATVAGDPAEAQRARRWIEEHADPSTGALPEQVPDDLIHPAMYEPWIEKWGPPADPLLWSHAMYIILVDAMGE
ncbi:MAG: glycoside hydrolase family 15 protein [Alkalispirochaeta sp.]